LEDIFVYGKHIYICIYKYIFHICFENIKVKGAFSIGKFIQPNILI